MNKGNSTPKIIDESETQIKSSTSDLPVNVYWAIKISAETAITRIEFIIISLAVFSMFFCFITMKSTIEINKAGINKISNVKVVAYKAVSKSLLSINT